MILLFPPVNSFRRLLIHSVVTEEFQGLKSFSVGEGDNRRTAICLESSYSEPMEQDVERQGRSSYNSRAWGHDDRCEVTPSEPLQRERSEAQSDRKARMKSKRPDQQIYVPRARRAPRGDVETRPGVAHDAVQDDPTHDSEKIKVKQVRGRGRASVERYIPKAKRNLANSDNITKSDRTEASDATRSEILDHTEDVSKLACGFRSHTKKMRSERSKHSSESEGRSLDDSLSSNSALHANVGKESQSEAGEMPSDINPESENTSDSIQLCASKDTSVLNFQPETVNLAIVNQDNADGEVENTTLKTDSMKEESSEGVQSVLNEGSDNLDLSEIPEQVPEIDQTSVNSAQERIDTFQSAATEVVPSSGSANENWELTSSTLSEEQTVVQVEPQDSEDGCKSSAPFVIKRENSFVENFEADKTLEVHYSENCHYDMDLERVDGTKGGSKASDIVQLENSSIDEFVTNKDNCDMSAFHPLKRQKSDDDYIDSKSQESVGDSVTSKNAKSSIASSIRDNDKQHSSKDISVPDEHKGHKTNVPIDTDSCVKSSCTFPDSVAMEISSNVPQEGKDAGSSSEQTLKETGVAMETAEDSWDAMFDDDGEALDPRIMDELTQKVGKVKVQKPQFDYLDFQPADPELDDEAYSHLIEIYDFPSEFLTRDLLAAFRTFQDKGFDVKWVDDTHCIGIFSSKIAAQSALDMPNPLIKVRPIAAASKQTKLKAKKHATSLEPYKPRPVTTAAVARNLVTNALGLTSRVPREKREEERRKLREAKEKKKEAQQLKIDIWDGKIGRCAMDDV